MTIYFNGGSVGDYRYVREADGTIRSSADLTVGTVKIVSKLAGRFQGDMPIEYELDQNRAGQSFKLALKDGKLTATVPGQKPSEIPYANPKVFWGSLHPVFTASLLKATDWDRKQVQSVKGFLIDGGTEVECKVTPLTEKTTSAGTARFYRAAAGTVAVDYAMTPDGRVVGMDVPGQKLRYVADGWSGLYVDPFAKYPELSAAKFNVKRLPTQRMKTRDGVELVQDVFLPDAEGKFPVVFSRTPYDRGNEALAADFYVKRGYAYVTQDCRGRTDSGGEWDPFVNERNDGYDAIDWIAKQPWCDGNVGMIGGSYGGFVQWAAAVERHPALKCIVPQVSPPLDAMRNLPYDHGVFFLYANVWWGKIVRDKKADMSTIQSSLPNPKGFLTLPLSKVDDAVLGHDVPFFDQWLRRPGLDQWKGWNFYDRLAQVDIPALHISGWWDGDEIGTNLNWEAMRRLGRRNQWLVYGPWTHFFNSTSSLGDTDYGSRAMIDLETLYIRWFDTWLKHKDVGLTKIPRVQAFVTGANKWLSLPDWPTAMAAPRTLYLGGPTKGSDKGRLLSFPVTRQAPSVYTYDPSKDVVGDTYLKVDPTKQTTRMSLAKNQKGILLFQSDPVKRPMAIAGPYEVSLTFKSSARDTDFFVNFVDVGPKGEMRVFGQGGKIRASYIGGLDRPRPIVPNKVYTAKIKPWDSAHQLAAGHRLALVISSTAFPAYARNLGTGEPIATGTKMVPQTNTIFHDAVRSSTIRFHVLWD